MQLAVLNPCALYSGMHSLLRATNQVSGRLSGRQRFLPLGLVPFADRPFGLSPLGRAVCFYGARCTSQKSRARLHYTSRAERCIRSVHFTFQRRGATYIHICGDRRRAAVLNLICEQSRLRSNLLFCVNATFLPYLIMICCCKKQGFL